MLVDPAGRAVEDVRAIRDDIDQRCPGPAGRARPRRRLSEAAHAAR